MPAPGHSAEREAGRAPDPDGLAEPAPESAPFPPGGVALSEEPAQSYRQILKSTSIVGGSSVFNIAIGLVRTKLAALLLGPSGIGLIGLFQTLVGAVAVVAGMGLGTAGTRQIAEAQSREDAAALAIARRALVWGTLLLAGLGGLGLFLLRVPVARHILRDEALSSQMGWLALGVAFTVATLAQTALLNGLRQIGMLAKVRILSALASTLVGCALLFIFRERAIAPFAIALPIATYAVGHVCVTRLPKSPAPSAEIRWAALCDQWKALLRIGVAVMLAKLAENVGLLAVRAIVQDELGANPLGQFEASWTIARSYLTLVLAAMGSDFYPRLTAVIQEPERARRLINEQSEIAQLIAGPMLILMMGCAPICILVLYSSQFAQSIDLLRFLVIGDLIKVAVWPLSFVVLAGGDGRRYFAVETAAVVVFSVLVALGVPRLGLKATGYAFIGEQLTYLPLLYFLARRRIGFCWSGSVKRVFGLNLLAVLIALFCALWHPAAGIAAGIALAGLSGLLGLRRILCLSALENRPRIRKLLDRFPFLRPRGSGP